MIRIPEGGNLIKLQSRCCRKFLGDDVCMLIYAPQGLIVWSDFSLSKNQAKKHYLCDLCVLERPAGAGERIQF